MTTKEVKCIYLDHHATTPMDERVFLKIKPFFLSRFGNPASINHPYGWRAQEAVDEAREEIARAINAHPSEIIFTSGATESTNTALKGLLHKKSQLITSSIEHQATLATAENLKERGVIVEFIRPTSQGIIEPSNFPDLKPCALVSLFMVHNEIGTINPIYRIATLVKQRGGIVHCDAAQAVGRVRIDVKALNVDLMSFSGHKIYGPKGVGCLYVSQKVFEKLPALLHGGGQEWHKRSGTLNVPGIVGLAEAFKLAHLDFDEENRRIKFLRDLLLDNLSVLDGIYTNGTLVERVSGNLNLSFDGINGEELVLAICQKVALSTGSACSARAGKTSKVLEEIGVPPALRQSSLRFGLGRHTTEDEINIASELIVAEVKRQRESCKKKLIKITRKC